MNADEYFAGFAADAATLVGEPNMREATTADDLPRQQIEAKVRAAIEADGNASVLAEYAKGNESVTACARKKTVVRACIGLLLSDQVTIPVAASAQARLWASFPEGTNALFAALGSIEGSPKPAAAALVMDAVKSAGKKEERLRRIHALLCRAAKHPRAGDGGVDCALEYLRETTMGNTEAFKELCGTAKDRPYPGIGPKSAACVLAFTAERPFLAVDVNVANFAHKLGWYVGKIAPPKAADTIQRGLNGMADEPSVKVVVPSEKRRAFHCFLLQLQMQHAKGTAERKKAVGNFITRWKLTSSLMQSTATSSGSSSTSRSHKNKKRAADSDAEEPQQTSSRGKSKRRTDSF